MDPEVQEQEELAATWQAGIDSFEAAGLAVENGVLTAPPIDGLDPSLDPDIIAALQDCIQAVNQQVSGGELALADIGFDGTIGAGQPGSPPVVAAGKENDGGGPGENGGSMRNDIEIHWWGVQAYLDENNTQQLLSLIDSGGDVIALLTAIDPEIKSKAALALGAVCAKIGAKIIKAVDENGGKHGVVLSRPWVGPAGWVTAQTG